MTEAEWRTGADPAAMLAFIRGRATDRKLRLLAVAFCRALCPAHGPDPGRAAVETAERYADGAATPRGLAAARRGASAVGTRAAVPAACCRRSAWLAATEAGSSLSAAMNAVVYPVPPVSGDPVEQARWESAVYVTALQEYGPKLPLAVREVFGNPFRPVAGRPAWLTPTATGLAHAIYTAHAFDRLPVLADALEEAGCNRPEVLAHCRGDGPHVRGCWVVDLVLGKR